MSHLTPEQRFWAKVNRQGPINPILKTPCWLWTHGVDSRGYGKFDNRQWGTWLAHRNAWAFTYGKPPEGLLDHHHMCPKRCVRPSHLREVTHKQNMENITGPQCNNRARSRGVRWHKGAWEAVVRHRGRYYYLGRFPSKDDAELAARVKRNQLFTHNDSDRELLRLGERRGTR
jgi:hypothetical protein